MHQYYMWFNVIRIFPSSALGRFDISFYQVHIFLNPYVHNLVSHTLQQNNKDNWVSLSANYRILFALQLSYEVKKK